MRICWRHRHTPRPRSSHHVTRDGPLPPLLRPYSRPRYYYVLPPTLRLPHPRYLLFVGAKVDARDSQGFGVVERAWGPSVGGTKHELIRTLQSPTRKVLPTYGFQNQRGAEL